MYVRVDVPGRRLVCHVDIQYTAIYEDTAAINMWKTKSQETMNHRPPEQKRKGQEILEVGSWW